MNEAQIYIDDHGIERFSNYTIIYGFDIIGHYRFVALPGHPVSDCERPPFCPNFRYPTSAEISRLQTFKRI